MTDGLDIMLLCCIRYVEYAFGLHATMLSWWCRRLDCISVALQRTWGSDWVCAHLAVHFCVAVPLPCTHASSLCEVCVYVFLYV